MVITILAKTGLIGFNTISILHLFINTKRGGEIMPNASTIEQKQAMLASFSEHIRQEFNAHERYLLNTKGLYHQQAIEIEGRANGATAEDVENLFGEYFLNAELFPELFMTSWIMAFFSNFEQSFEAGIPKVASILGCNFDARAWNGAVKNKGKFVAAKKYITDTLNISIAAETWESFQFYKRLRDHLTHQGRNLKVIHDNPKKLYLDIARRGDIRCVLKRGSHVSGKGEYKIVVDRSFATSMCSDMKLLFTTFINGASDRLRQGDQDS